MTDFAFCRPIGAFYLLAAYVHIPEAVCRAYPESAFIVLTQRKNFLYALVFRNIDHFVVFGGRIDEAYGGVAECSGYCPIVQASNGGQSGQQRHSVEVQFREFDSIGVCTARRGVLEGPANSSCPVSSCFVYRKFEIIRYIGHMIECAQPQIAVPVHTTAPEIVVHGEQQPARICVLIDVAVSVVAYCTIDDCTYFLHI